MASSRNANSSCRRKKYPYPTEYNVMDFVPKLLSEGNNYNNWKLLMRDFVDRRGLIGFIDGSTAAEESNERHHNKAWKKSDNLVQGWILTTLSEDIRIRMLSSKTAQDLWMELEKTFDATIPFWNFDEEMEHRICHYLDLQKAATDGDWDKAKEIIEDDPDAVRTPITPFYESALTLAITSAGRNRFVRQLLEKMTPLDVKDLVDDEGSTALHLAAIVDNMEAAKMLVNKNPELPNLFDQVGKTPIHWAAANGHRDMVLYLKEVTREDILLANDDAAASLLCYLTRGELYDIALTLLQQKPELACMKGKPNALDIMVENRSSFPSGNSFNFWQRLIYLGVPMKSEGNIQNLHKEGGRGDIENSVVANCCISVRQRLHFTIWEVAEKLVPHIKHIREIKEKQHHAIEFVKFLCMEVAKSKFSEVERIFRPALRTAACVGIPEVIEEIILSQPVALFFKNLDNLNIFKYAIMYRREHVFNLIYQINAHWKRLSGDDNLMDNSLHFAARLRHQQEIDLKASAAGAVLQMQREVQWFKEVEKFAALGDKEIRNVDGMTPAEVFSDTHQDLVKESERWMKDTATSCTIVAALIATMVFAAAITVPGGNNSDNGHPLLAKKKAFGIFGISDALALFSSITSVLMFLLILTSRYAEEDFQYTLPKRLIIGLITLFVSILSTMVAFAAILYLVFGGNQAWILIPIVALASIPVTLFGALQFPLLIEMIQSTYGRGIFYKQSNRVIG